MTEMRIKLDLVSMHQRIRPVDVNSLHGLLACRYKNIATLK